MFKTLKPKQGSVLVFSLIVLSILLSAAVAVATVSVANRRSTFSTAKSSQSFQVADSGVELILQQIYKTVPTHASINALAAALGGGATCASGAITKAGVAGGDIKVSFYDKDDNLINCADTAWRSKVVAIKSEGTAGETTRLVETAVAAGSDFAWIPIDPFYSLINDPVAGGDTDYGSYIASGSNRLPSEQCVRAGYLYATGSCKADASGWEREGSIVSGRNPADNSGYISCAYWFRAYSPRNMKILCAK